MTSQTPFHHSSSFLRDTQTDQEFIISIALEEADIAAQMSTHRLTHEEVFLPLRKILNSTLNIDNTAQNKELP
ncbi:MAG: hypothetical protein IJ335_12440 [Lachnospiraceae bacterium]|nr:hypothetical protein [Lachnospiraceae bacterium]